MVDRDVTARIGQVLRPRLHGHPRSDRAPGAGQTAAPGLDRVAAIHECQGEPRFALDLVETSLDRLGITSASTFVDASGFTGALLTGPFDGSAAAWKDPQRERELIFSQPYL